MQKNLIKIFRKEKQELTVDQSKVQKERKLLNHTQEVSEVKFPGVPFLARFYRLLILHSDVLALCVSILDQY